MVFTVAKYKKDRKLGVKMTDGRQKAFITQINGGDKAKFEVEKTFLNIHGFLLFIVN